MENMGNREGIILVLKSTRIFTLPLSSLTYSPQKTTIEVPEQLKNEKIFTTCVALLGKHSLPLLHYNKHVNKLFTISTNSIT